jgi:hypothetical protein
MRGSEAEGEGEGDDGCGNVAPSNIEDSFLLRIYPALFGYQMSL